MFNSLYCEQSWDIDNLLFWTNRSQCYLFIYMIPNEGVFLLVGSKSPRKEDPPHCTFSPSLYERERERDFVFFSFLMMILLVIITLYFCGGFCVFKRGVRTRICKTVVTTDQLHRHGFYPSGATSRARSTVPGKIAVAHFAFSFFGWSLTFCLCFQ